MSDRKTSPAEHGKVVTFDSLLGQLCGHAMNREAAETVEALDGVRAMLRALEARTVTAEARVAELQAEVGEMDALYKDAQATVADQLGKLEALRTRVAELERDWRRAFGDRAELTRMVQDQSMRLTELRTQNEALVARVEQRKRGWDIAEDRITQLEVQNAALVDSRRSSASKEGAVMTEAEVKAVLALYGLEKLEDGTRDKWPSHWWYWKADKPYGRFWSEDLEPRMPNFHTDDAAAVKLAEKVGQRGIHMWIEPPFKDGECWSVDGLFARTLGSALLAALTSSQEKP